jgi:MinD superfamily P-loop ATPase
MIVAVASGKGGTGKTTVAVGLALSLVNDAHGKSPQIAETMQAVHPLLVDCDVEEPNAALFLGPTIRERRDVGQITPEVDAKRCTQCGRCAEVCQFHAIAVVGEKVLVFPELCHGCGSCTLSCPAAAISESLHATGSIERGWAGPVEFAHGTMNVGEAMAVPIIRQLKSWVVPSSNRRPVILDAPPGTACPVVETLRRADFVLLVTEPTPFGLHDLRLAVDVARKELGLPVGVVINRDGIGDGGVEGYCAAESVPILMRIPLDRRIAVAYSDGVSLLEVLPEYRGEFIRLYASIGRIVAKKGAVHTR